MGFTATDPAGSKVRGSKLATWFTEVRPLYATLVSSAPFTSNAVLADLTGLYITLLTNTEYTFDLNAFAVSAANAAGDVKYAFTFPANSTVYIGASGPHNALASGSQSDMESFAVRSITSSPTTSIPFGCSTTETLSVVKGRIITTNTAGILQVQAAQQASNVNATTVLAGSWLEGKKVN